MKVSALATIVGVVVATQANLLNINSNFTTVVVPTTDANSGVSANSTAAVVSTVVPSDATNFTTTAVVSTVAPSNATNFTTTAVVSTVALSNATNFTTTVVIPTIAPSSCVIIISSTGLPFIVIPTPSSAMSPAAIAQQQNAGNSSSQIVSSIYAIVYSTAPGQVTTVYPTSMAVPVPTDLPICGGASGTITTTNLSTAALPGVLPTPSANFDDRVGEGQTGSAMAIQGGLVGVFGAVAGVVMLAL